MTGPSLSTVSTRGDEQSPRRRLLSAALSQHSCSSSLGLSSQCYRTNQESARCPRGESSTVTAPTSLSSPSQPHHSRSRSRQPHHHWTKTILTLLSLLTLSTWTMSLVQAQIVCSQTGSDTIRVGSTIRFSWSDAGAAAVNDAFTLNLYCHENGVQVQQIQTLSLATSTSPVTWTVTDTILASLPNCPMHQYHGAFDWGSTNTDTDTAVTSSAICKPMLLVGEGVQQPLPSGDPNNPTKPDPEDEPSSGDIVVTDKTKTILIAVGCVVGLLIIAGFVAFYFIRYKNRRAEEEHQSKKLREPLAGSNGGTAGAASGGAKYSELESVHTSMAGYSPETVELGRVSTPIASAHSMLRPSAPAHTNERPVSLLTSSFIPDVEPEPTRIPPPPPSAAVAQKEVEQEQIMIQQQQYEQQQQQQLQMQMHQQQQQQLNYGTYPY